MDTDTLNQCGEGRRTGKFATVAYVDARLLPEGYDSTKKELARTFAEFVQECISDFRAYEIRIEKLRVAEDLDPAGSFVGLRLKGTVFLTEPWDAEIGEYASSASIAALVGYGKQYTVSLDAAVKTFEWDGAVGGWRRVG